MEGNCDVIIITDLSTTPVYVEQPELVLNTVPNHSISVLHVKNVIQSETSGSKILC